MNRRVYTHKNTEYVFIFKRKKGFLYTFERSVVETTVRQARRLIKAYAKRRTLWGREFEGIPYVDPERRLSINVVFIDAADKDHLGVGSGGAGGAKVFWCPYMADDCGEVRYRKGWGSRYEYLLGIDPVFVLSHELYHAFGGTRELSDTFTLVNWYNVVSEKLPWLLSAKGYAALRAWVMELNFRVSSPRKRIINIVKTLTKAPIIIEGPRSMARLDLEALGEKLI